MFKRIKDRRGFTLIELMMVVAVIGILAAVLIPKIGGMKDTAKLSGLDSNVRQVEAHINGLINRYDEVDEFRDGLVEAINEGETSPSDADGDLITNPFNESQVGAVEDGNGGSGAVVVGTSDDDNNLSKGQIYVYIHSDGDELQAQIYRFDSDESTAVTTISQ